MTTPLNYDLIGQAGSAGRLQTPALVVDLDRLERNIERMASFAARNDIRLRPHAKTHKCSEIAKRQIRHGAIGICCAKLGEAEALGAAGLDNILLTSPIVGDGGIARLMALNERSPGLMIVVDNIENILALSRAVPAGAGPLDVLLDLDPGLHRTGMSADAAAVDTVKRIADDANLNFRGLQMYAGNLMHIAEYADRRSRSQDVLAKMQAFRERLSAEGLDCDILSGGGTGTFDIDPEVRALTELQVGSYVFMDSQYRQMEGKDRDGLPFETSLFVQMSVISNNTPGVATTDAGLKSFATDAGPPILAEGGFPGSKFGFFGDEFGGVQFADKGEFLALGSPLRAVTPHCDPTVNLYRHLHVIKGDTLVDIWPIEASGCSA